MVSNDVVTGVSGDILKSDGIYRGSGEIWEIKGTSGQGVTRGLS